MSCIMATYCSGIPFLLNDHQIKFHNLSDSVIYDSLPQLHGVCHQLEKRWDMHDLLLFRKNRSGARSVILEGHRSVKIPIPRRCTPVSLTRNVVCRRYTNITRVKITRVIFDPGQNDGSVDVALLFSTGKLLLAAQNLATESHADYGRSDPVQLVQVVRQPSVL